MHKKPQLWNTMVIWSPHLTASDPTWENSWTAVKCIPGTSSNDHIQTWEKRRQKINNITSNGCCNITRQCSSGDNYCINTCMVWNSLARSNHAESMCTPENLQSTLLAHASGGDIFILLLGLTNKPHPRMEIPSWKQMKSKDFLAEKMFQSKNWSSRVCNCSDSHQVSIWHIRLQETSKKPLWFE